MSREWLPLRYVHCMVPSHNQRRAVLWVSLQAQSMSTINNMVPAPLRAQDCCFPLLGFCVFFFCATFSGSWCWWWLRRGSSGAPRRQIGEEALLAVWGRHTVERQGVSTVTDTIQPSLGTISGSLDEKPPVGLVSAEGTSGNVLQKRDGQLLVGEFLSRSKGYEQREDQYRDLRQDEHECLAHATCT